MLQSNNASQNNDLTNVALTSSGEQRAANGQVTSVAGILVLFLGFQDCGNQGDV